MAAAAVTDAAVGARGGCAWATGVDTRRTACRVVWRAASERARQSGVADPTLSTLLRRLAVSCCCCCCCCCCCVMLRGPGSTGRGARNSPSPCDVPCAFMPAATMTILCVASLLLLLLLLLPAVSASRLWVVLLTKRENGRKRLAVLSLSFPPCFTSARCQVLLLLFFGGGGGLCCCCCCACGRYRL